MSFQNRMAATCAALGLLFIGNQDALAQTAPSLPLKQPTPHYILGVPLPKFDLRGRLLKPTLRLYFPDDPNGFSKNRKDMIRKSITTEDKRTHPVIDIHDIRHPFVPVDTLLRDHIRALNLG